VQNCKVSGGPPSASVTTQSRVGISKETHHGRSEKNHRAEARQDKLLRNLRMRILFLRVPGKRLSLRANQLPMWLPQANRRSVGQLCPARHNPAGGDTDSTGRAMCAGDVSGLLVGLARLGHSPFERAGFPDSSRLRPLYQSFPNQTGGKGAHAPIRPGIRSLCDSSATMEMMWYMRDRTLTRIALAIGRFDCHFSMKPRDLIPHALHPRFRPSHR